MTTVGTSLACYGCVEFANNERTMAYYKWACSEGMFPQGCAPSFFDLCWCPADSPEDAFVDPITDNVCWYDSAVPESSEFLGVVILNRVDKDSTFSREVTDGFLEGSILGRPIKKGRSFVFDAFMLATSEKGMAYGYEWLRTLLEDAPCSSSASSGCTSCFGKRMGLRVFCPDGDSVDTGFHEWYSVGCVDGLKNNDDGNTRRQCCDIIQPVTFTMQSESPYSFAPEAISICESEASLDNYLRCFNWLTDCVDEEIEDSRCLVDPLCDDVVSLDFDPALSNQDCSPCTPLAKVIQACCTDDLPAVYDTTFKIDIYSGVNPGNAAFLRRGMRDFRLKIYQNPKGLPCIEDEETEALWANEMPCIEFATSYIPYDATITIDGRYERVLMTCGNICRAYEFAISSVEGPLFPLLSRCTPLMIAAEFSYYTSQFEPAAAGIKPSKISVDSYLRFRN